MSTLLTTFRFRLNLNRPKKGSIQWPKRSRFEVGLDGIVHQTNSWASCKPSDTAELKNEDGAIPLCFEESPRVSALSSAAENTHALVMMTDWDSS